MSKRKALEKTPLQRGTRRQVAVAAVDAICLAVLPRR